MAMPGEPDSASATAHLQLAVAFSLLLFPLVLSALLVPILRATQHAPYQRSAPLVLVSLAALGLAGVCGLAGLAGGRESATLLGGVLLVLAQLFLDVHLLLSTVSLLEKLYYHKPAVGLLSVVLLASSAMHIVLVATPTNDGRSVVVPALRTVAHVLFDLGVCAVLARDVSLALIQLSSLPSNVTRERSSPEPQDGGVTPTQLDKERVRQFSNPWRPASLQDQSDSRTGIHQDDSPPHALLQLRSFRLTVLQSISVAIFIAATSLPISYDYSTFTKSGRVMASVFGTTTSPAGYLALTILVLLRWTGVAIDLALRNGPEPPTSPPPSPNDPLRSFGLRPSHPPIAHRSHGPGSRSLYPPPPSSPTPSSVPSRSNTSRHAVHSYDARKSPLILPASRQRHGSRGSSSSQRSLPPPAHLFPPRLDTPPISGVDLADGLGISFPTTGSSHTLGAGGFGSAGSGSGRRSKTRPSVAALHLSLVESPSPTFDRSGMLTPTTPRTPRTPLRRVGSVDRISAPLELEVEGGDPFSREPSAEALVEMWKRERDGVELTETSLTGSLLRALEDVMEGGRDTASEPDDGDGEYDGGALEADRTVSSTFTEEMYEDAMTRPTPQTPEPRTRAVNVNVIAATPSTATDSTGSSPRPRRPSRIPVPQIQSRFVDPFPAPSFASRAFSSPPTFQQLGTPSRRSSTSRVHSEHSIPPHRPYSSTPPVSPSPSRASYGHGPPSPTSLWSSAPSSALRKVLGRDHSRKRSQDSSHSDESFSCVGDTDRASVASFAPGHTHGESSDDVEHLRRDSDSPGSAGLKQLRLPGLVSVQEEGSGSSTSSIKSRFRRREKRSWWNLSATSSTSRPGTPSSPSPPRLWSGLQIRHSSSFPALNELRRADGLPRAASSVDFSGARSDTRMSAPAGRRSRLFGSSSPDRTSRTSTPRPVGARRDSGSGSGSSSHLHSSSDSHYQNNPMPQRHHYRQVQSSSPPSAHRPPPRKPSRIPVPRRLLPTSEPESPSSGPDDTFDSILKWDLPRLPDTGSDAAQLNPHVDAAHFGFRRLPRAQNYSSTSSASARDTLASMCGSDRPLVTHSRESTFDEMPPPRTRSRPASLDSTRGFLRDTLAALDSPTSSSSAAMSPRSDFGWPASPASDSTGFSDGSEPPRSPWAKRA